MNKLKTETKIGIIVLSTIALIIWGINFLKGKNVLKRSDVYYAVFDDIQGIDVSAPVLINGYKVGLVNDIRFKDNTAYVLEINPNPSIAEQGCGYVNAVKAHGLSYRDMVDALLKNALNKMDRFPEF